MPVLVAQEVGCECGETVGRRHPLLPGRSGPLKCMRVGPSIREQKDRFMREKSIGVECDEQCLNRAQSIECTNENCGVNGGTCNNRQFHLGRSPKIDVRKKDGEWGLVAARAAGQETVHH